VYDCALESERREVETGNQMERYEKVPSPPVPGASAWAKLVPFDSAFPEVEVVEDGAVVCSLVSPSGGEEFAWCKIRRGGDASSATIWNLRLVIETPSPQVWSEFLRHQTGVMEVSSCVKAEGSTRFGLASPVHLAAEGIRDGHADLIRPSRSGPPSIMEIAGSRGGRSQSVGASISSHDHLVSSSYGQVERKTKSVSRADCISPGMYRIEQREEIDWKKKQAEEIRAMLFHSPRPQIMQKEINRIHEDMMIEAREEVERLADLKEAGDRLKLAMNNVGMLDARRREVRDDDGNGPGGPSRVPCTHEAIFNHSKRKPHVRWVWIS
jgi:hypothetical protein